jgi:hypothetical protein
MKTKKLVSPYSDSPKIPPGEADKKSPILIYVIGGLALLYFLTMKNK